MISEGEAGGGESGLAFGRGYVEAGREGQPAGTEEGREAREEMRELSQRVKQNYNVCKHQSKHNKCLTIIEQ